MTPNSTYRPDIDGLRAVAVLAVVLHHLSASLMPGGYVGMDVFFVISGYLITRIISREMAQGTFTFSRFYERWARRVKERKRDLLELEQQLMASKASSAQH